jgi:hypothetical protein
LLETFIELYPKEERPDIEGRLHSREETNFRSSVFELALYAILIKLGAMVEVHPRLDNGKSFRPDFKVTFQAGSVIYLEAVLASESSEYTPAGQRRANKVLEALNSEPHHSFRIAIQLHGEPSRQPSSNTLIREIHTWLDSLNPDNSESEAKWIHAKDGWHVRFQAIPILPEKRGTAKSLILSSARGARAINHSNGIRNAIVNKARKYGRLPAPLVVAVNSDSFDLDGFEVMNSLYGGLSYNFVQDRPDIKSGFSRERNGAWIGAKGPRYRNVIGTWIFKDLHAYSLSTCAHRHYINPYSETAIPAALMSVPTAVAVDKDTSFREGMGLKDLLNLGDDWPSPNS